jgi:hypothetical protein
MGFDFIGEVDYHVTSWGSCDSWEEPGDPIEVEIESIVVFRDEGKSVVTPQHEVTGAWFDVLEPAAYEAACLQASEDGPYDDGDYEYDRRRDERTAL